MARSRDGGDPWEFEKLETHLEARALEQARRWLAEGKIVRVLRRNEFGLYEVVPPERWVAGESDRCQD